MVHDVVELVRISLYSLSSIARSGQLRTADLRGDLKLCWH